MQTYKSATQQAIPLKAEADYIKKILPFPDTLAKLVHQNMSLLNNAHHENALNVANVFVLT